MTSKWPVTIRQILRSEEDGCTIAELADRLGAPKMSVAAALERMPDTYVDRWTEAGQQRPYEAIWCVVVPPENCPKPERKIK
jgi:DNA-binding IclR family transcriptional regulator